MIAPGVACRTFARLVDELVVYPDRMLENLNLTRGVIFSQKVLLKLAEKGMTRERAYAVVQENAMRAWVEGIEFKDLLLSDKRVKSVLGPWEIDEVFRLENFLGNVLQLQAYLRAKIIREEGEKLKR